MTQNEKAQNKILTNLEKSIQSVINAFCHKHEIEFDYSVSDDLTGVLCFGDNFFNLSDIYFDLKENKPKGKIIEWQNYLTDYNIKTNGNHTNQFIRFNSYCMGARFDDLKI